MEILQLKYFISAAQSESFTAAAKKYGVPVSDISQTIKRLEGELGVQLFGRSANRVSLSEQGRVFLEGVRRAMTELDNATLRVREFSSKVCGDIRLLILTNRRVVTEAIERYRGIYPDVTFHLSHNPLDSGDCDAIISDVPPRGGMYDERLLVEERILIAASPQCLPEDFDPKRATLADFQNARFITMPEQSSHCRITRSLCRSCGFTPNVGITCDDPYYVRKYVEMGLGVTLVPSFSWMGQFSDPAVLFDVGPFTRATYLYLARPMSLALKELVPIIENAFGGER